MSGPEATNVNSLENSMKFAKRRAALAAIVIAGAGGVAGCSAGDEASAVDTGAAAATRPMDTAAPAVMPQSVPPTADTTRSQSAARRNLPPVAGETVKRPATDPRERDSVTAPLFEVGEDGKVRPIKR